MTRLFPGFAIMLCLAGCVTVGPDYVRPDTAVPKQWSAELGGSLTTERPDTETLASWWETLHDPVLTSLIHRAVEGNLDFRKARARVLEARARRGVAGADRFPSIDATASAGRNRSSQETGGGTTRNLYSAGFDSSWELDLFGGIKRSVEAAEGELQASEEDLRDVLVSLLAEVALNYVDVRSFQTRLSLAEANRDVQQQTYLLVQNRFNAGLTTHLDVEQARYNLEQTRAQIPTLQTGLEQAKNRIAVLLGEPPGSLKETLAERKAIPVAPVSVAVGVPADQLRRRPDVRSAERRLAAQTANVGVATADLYPNFSLTGSIGLEALSSGNLISSGSRTYGIRLPISWNVFDAGRIRENINVQNALEEQARIQYHTVILTALEDVENAMVAYANEQARQESLLQASQAAQRAVNLSQDQYDAGLTDFQNVLNAERSLFSLQDQLAESQGKVTSGLISLYKALGGGWTTLAPETESSFYRSGEIR